MFSIFTVCGYIFDHKKEFSKRSVVVVSECSDHLEKYGSDLRRYGLKKKMKKKPKLESRWSGVIGVHPNSGQDLYLRYCHRIDQNFF